MIDDPFVLLAYGILLLAGGMYPIGFLFGACSACCECGPCEECTHYNKSNCEFSYANFTYQLSGYDEVSIDCPNKDEIADTDTANSTDIAFESLPEGYQFSAFDPNIGFIELLSEANQDECNCNRCKLTVSSRIRIGIQGSDEYLILECEFTGYAEACSVTEIPFTMGQWGVILNPGISEAAVNAALQWANSLDITASVTLRQGCCSKCVRAYSEECYDLSGDWTMQLSNGNLVTGTIQDGDLDGPANAYSLFTLPFTCRNASDTAEYTLQIGARIDEGPLEIFRANDECGCLSCCEPNLQAQFLLVGEPDVAIPGQSQQFSDDGVQHFFSFAICECSEDSVTVTIPLQNAIDYASFITERLTSECADSYTAWASEQSLVFTLTNIVPCECGACCDDGCEENVAEGGCTAWQGVGTDCCPSPCEEE